MQVTYEGLTVEMDIDALDSWDLMGLALDSEGDPLGDARFVRAAMEKSMDEANQNQLIAHCCGKTSAIISTFYGLMRNAGAAKNSSSLPPA
jgi:hypothetical protein